MITRNRLLRVLSNRDDGRNRDRIKQLRLSFLGRPEIWHVLAESGAMCPGERRGGLSGPGGSSFAKGEAQQVARRGQRNRTQTGMM